MFHLTAARERRCRDLGAMFSGILSLGLATIPFCRANLPDKCTECRQVVERQPSIQPSVRVADVEPS